LKKRIAVIGLKGLPATGGAATVGESLIDYLRDYFEFEVLSTASHAKDQTVKGISQIIFPAHKNPKINTLFYYLRCALFVLFKRKYDLVHLHHAESGFITPLLRLRYKVVTTYHGMFLDEYSDPKFSKLTNRFFRFSQWINLSLSNINISVSKIDTKKVNSKAGKELIRYIPNGIRIPKLNSPRESKGYITFAANRIYHIKGLHTLIEAFRKSGIQKTLKVIGDLTQIPKYKTEIESISRGLNIEFIGKIHDKEILFDTIRDSDYFIFPSEKEAMPMMLLEVVALRIPVIASDIPEVRVIFDENELIFFQSQNPIDLANKLLILENDADLGVTIAQNAYKKVVSEYRWEHIAAQYRGIYSDLLKMSLSTPKNV
jgi:glycosyltransferase involved in cell wall biosynthesis